MSTEQDYDAAAEWAEKDMTLAPGSTTALRGTAAVCWNGRPVAVPLSTRQPVQGTVPGYARSAFRPTSAPGSTRWHGRRTTASAT